MRILFDRCIKIVLSIFEKNNVIVTALLINANMYFGFLSMGVCLLHVITLYIFHNNFIEFYLHEKFNYFLNSFANFLRKF